VCARGTEAGFRELQVMRAHCGNSTQLLLLLLLLLFTAIELSLDGSTDKTKNIHKRNNTKKTQYKQYKTQ
jgi:hypothetical protein